MHIISSLNVAHENIDHSSLQQQVYHLMAASGATDTPPEPGLIEVQ